MRRFASCLNILFYCKFYHQKEPPIDTDTFTEELEQLLAEDRVAQKWLIAPSLRTGYQWLDRLTRNSVPLMNVHVRTLREVALSIAAPELVRRKLKYSSNLKLECIIAAVFEKLVKNSGCQGYLSSLVPDVRLFSAFRRTLADISLAGLKEQDIPAGKFEVALKGEEIKTLLRLYKEELHAAGGCDYAAVLEIASRELKAASGDVFRNVAAIVITDSELESLSYLERGLWETFPAAICRVAVSRRPDDAPGNGLPAIRCLAWLDSPQNAPAPAADNSVEMFHSLGEVNEVQEVFRRILAEGIPFDNVELIHTNPAEYLPVIYEESFKLCTADTDEIPVTFSEGIPAAYFRPVRSLSFWLDWIGDNYPQRSFSAAIREGLLRFSPEKETSPGFQRIAAELDKYPIGSGRERYGRILDRAISDLKSRREQTEPASGEYRELDGRLGRLKSSIALTSGLIQLAACKNSENSILDCAEEFLGKYARSVGQLDNYAHKALLEKVRELIRAYSGSKYHPEHAELLLRLREAIAGLKIQGQGPRPGMIFVSPLSQAGHSGRPVTYILGLNEVNFPGAGSQDPLFLDIERGRVSSNLVTSDKRVERVQNNLYRLVRGLNGRLTLSYSSRSVEDDREVSSSIVFLSAFRIVSGKRDGDYSDMLGYLGPPVSFVPPVPENALTVSQASAPGLLEVDSAERTETLRSLSPVLARGNEALKERGGSVLTPFDGYVPAAGAAIFSADSPPVISASALEMAARSPYDYFLRHILHIKPVEPLVPPAGGWLRNDQRGLILHETFSSYYRTLIERRGQLTGQPFDRELAHKVLHDTIERFTDQFPPARDDLVSRDIRDLEESVDIFLAVERDPENPWRPCYFETAIGMEPDRYPSALDSRSPVEVNLGGGIAVRLRGRIDRVDIRERGANKEVIIWDYKTGSAGSYKEDSPFGKGMKLQGVIYPLLVEKRISEVLGENTVLYGFGYYLASDRGNGERISWRLDQLTAGKEILANIAEMLKRGVFPAGEEALDPRWNDLYDAYWDADAMSTKTKNLLEKDDPLLSSLKRIRELGDKIELD